MKKTLLIFLILFFLACSISKKENLSFEEKKEAVVFIPPEEIKEETKEEIVEVEVLEPVIEVEEEVIEVFPVIPEVEELLPHPAVEEAINFYVNNYFEKYKKALEGFYLYKSKMEEIFINYGLPTDFIYMTLTESLFNPKAKSRKGAYGVWQFIRPTAKLFGLKIDSFIDERADYIKSTIAAAKYLKEAYDTFNKDLLLSIASYNCGIGNVLKAQKKCNAREFWEIRKCLPKETRNFVPSVLASIEIGKNPSKYGFFIEEKEIPNYEEIFLPYSLNLKKIAQNTNLDLQRIREINPELKSHYTPPYGYNLKLEPKDKEIFISALPYHSSKEGETLKELEEKYKVKAETIAKANKIKLNEKLREGQKIFIPEEFFEGYHIVQRGENPFSISKKYGISLEKFLEANGLTKKSIIHPGQKLKVPGGIVLETKIYKVKKGDTLAKIAKKFSTTVEKIMQINELKSTEIKPGLILQIE